LDLNVGPVATPPLALRFLGRPPASAWKPTGSVAGSNA